MSGTSISLLYGKVELRSCGIAPAPPMNGDAGAEHMRDRDSLGKLVEILRHTTLPAERAEVRIVVPEEPTTPRNEPPDSLSVVLHGVMGVLSIQKHQVEPTIRVTPEEIARNGSDTTIDLGR